MSPLVQRVVLSGGAVLYASLIGLAVAFGRHPEFTSTEQLQRELVRYDGGYIPHEYEQRFGRVDARINPASFIVEKNE